MLDLQEYIKAIKPVEKSYGELVRAHENRLTKPQGSLGRLEELAITLGEIKRQELPVIKRKVIFTLAGDHGVVAEGVSAFPQEVTPQMVYNFVNQGAAINVLAKQAGADMIIGDLGVAVDMPIGHVCFRNRKINKGTQNFTKGPAMSRQEALLAITAGIEIFEEEMAKERMDLVGTGEMGIGNTTSATAILAVVSGEPIEEIVGRGTGINDDGLIRKISAIKRGIERNQPDKTDGIDILSKVGGYEIGGLVGVILAAARHQVPVLLDGFISTSAALIARLLAPLSVEYMLAAHQSEERGHKTMLTLLGKKPLLDLGLRLGEGTGAALAMLIVEAGVRILHEMATFASAGVATKS